MCKQGVSLMFTIKAADVINETTREKTASVGFETAWNVTMVAAAPDAFWTKQNNFVK